MDYKKEEDLETYLFFDERGDTKNGMPNKNLPIFFSGCVHTYSENRIKEAHERICDVLNYDYSKEIHYKDLRGKKQKAYETLLNSPGLKFSVGRMNVKSFGELREEILKHENTGMPFLIGTAKYSKFQEMAQTELNAEIVWIIYGGSTGEEPVKKLFRNGVTPKIEYHISPRSELKFTGEVLNSINQENWQEIHLDGQTVKHGVKVKLEETNSIGVQLADVLVGGFSDYCYSAQKMDEKFIPVKPSPGINVYDFTASKEQGKVGVFKIGSALNFQLNF